MAVLILDPHWVKRVLAERKTTDDAQYDEVWDGTYILMPSPDRLHQDLVFEFITLFRSLSLMGGRNQIVGRLEVSDRVEGWDRNFRLPDSAVILPGTRARHCGTHWCGGPDFLVEILSPYDLARDKIPFYEKIGVRELLIVDRDPWALEL